MRIKSDINKVLIDEIEKNKLTLSLIQDQIHCNQKNKKLI
jgi:hypothetical protein